MALCLRFAPERTRILDSLSVNAYSMYLLHYVFIVWLQYALLPVGLFAIGKAAIVFGGTLALTWAAAVAFGNRPGPIISPRPSDGWARASVSRRRSIWSSRTICPDDVPGSNARWMIRRLG